MSRWHVLGTSSGPTPWPRLTTGLFWRRSRRRIPRSSLLLWAGARRGSSSWRSQWHMNFCRRLRRSSGLRVRWWKRTSLKERRCSIFATTSGGCVKSCPPWATWRGFLALCRERAMRRSSAGLPARWQCSPWMSVSHQSPRKCWKCKCFTTIPQQNSAEILGLFHRREYTCTIMGRRQRRSNFWLNLRISRWLFLRFGGGAKGAILSLAKKWNLYDRGSFLKIEYIYGIDQSSGLKPWV